MSDAGWFPVRELALRNGWRAEVFGQSVEGRDLIAWWPTSTPTRILWAAIHGEETATMQLAHQLLRTVHADDSSAVVVPVLNPDGVLYCTRQNANGVDLNRNFPGSNWRPGMSPTFWPTTMTRTTEFRTQISSPGSDPGSEPEVQAILQLIEEVQPTHVVDIHAPLEFMIARSAKGIEFAQWVAEPLGFSVRTEMESPTPGDSISWIDESYPGIAAFTYEIEADTLPKLWHRHQSALGRVICEPGTLPVS